MKLLSKITLGLAVITFICLLSGSARADGSQPRRLDRGRTRAR